VIIRRVPWWRALRAAVFAAACAGPVAAQRVMPTRIVTLGGAVTETVFALGAGAQVVGVDKSSAYPAAVARLPSVGYFRNAGAEGIVALAPTLVLADTGTAPTTVAQLRGAGVRVVLLPVGESMAVAVDRILRVGTALGQSTRARALAASVTAGTVAAERAARARSPHPRALFIYARGMGTVFVAGTNTGGAEMLRLAGATNAAAQLSGYKPFTAEAVATSGAEVIVLPKNGLASLGGIDGVLALPGLAQTPAGRSRRIVTLDDSLLLGFGPRLPDAVMALARGIAESVSAGATAPAPNGR
jgi:iron complex transport system substrate-binding protein